MKGKESVGIVVSKFKHNKRDAFRGYIITPAVQSSMRKAGLVVLNLSTQQRSVSTEHLCSNFSSFFGMSSASLRGNFYLNCSPRNRLLLQMVQNA